MDQFMQNILLITYYICIFVIWISIHLYINLCIILNVLNIHISIFSLENIIIKV